MREYPAAFDAALQAAPQDGIAPVFFFHVEPIDKATGDPVSLSFWTGHDDVTVSIARPDGGSILRTYLGGRGLKVGAITYVADLTDQQVSVSLSQIAPEAQQLVRQYSAQQAYCEIHATTMQRGVFAADPQQEWIGVVDKAPLRTPAVDGEGEITLSVRSELMWQLGRSNPTKSSHEHQRRRSATDDFCKLATTAALRKVQWG